MTNQTQSQIKICQLPDWGMDQGAKASSYIVQLANDGSTNYSAVLCL